MATQMISTLESDRLGDIFQLTSTRDLVNAFDRGIGPHLRLGTIMNFGVTAVMKGNGRRADAERKGGAG